MTAIVGNPKQGVNLHPAETGEMASNANRTLELVTRLTQELHAANVRYCHWKSNEHLAASLAGGDDLDILISREDSALAEAIFARLGFKHFIPIPLKRYNGITDFIGFDEASGNLVHLHTHYSLTLGVHRLKNFTLPWENDILKSVIPAPGETPIPIPSPEIEMLVLIVRTCLKIRIRDRVFGGQHRRLLRKDFEPDRAWLAERLDVLKLETASARWLPPQLWPVVRRAAAEPCNRKAILELRKAVLRHVSNFRTYGPVHALFSGLTREAAWVFGVLNKRYLQWPLPWGRTAPRGGAIICILGADGAGKSTLTREITRWLRFKLDALPLYLGSGSGPSSFPRKILILIRKIVPRPDRHAASKKPRDSTAQRGAKQLRSPVMKAGLLAWAILLAVEKRNKLRRAWRASRRGMIVIADRFPQTQTLGFNDGPLLQMFVNSPWRLLRAVARWELDIYRHADRMAPTLVIKLDVPADVALARKPDMSREEIERRKCAVAAMTFSDQTRVVVIPADLPFSEVLSRAKKEIWSVV
jgi:thymidylate kinase